MTDDQEPDDVVDEPVATVAHSESADAAAIKFDHGVGRTLGAQVAMDAGAGVGGALGAHVARIGSELVSRHAAFGAEAATAAGRTFDFTTVVGTRLAGMESVGERVSAAAKSWMNSAGGAHGALTAAASAGAAFKFDGIASTPGVQAAMKAMAGPGLSGVLGNAGSGADLIGRYPGLDAIKGYGYDFAKLAGVDPNGIGGLAALKIYDGVGRLSGVQAAMNALASPGIKGILGSDLTRFGMDWANGDLGYRHGLTDLLGVGGALTDHVSIFNKVMGDSQRALHESMGRWASSMTGPTAWMTEAMRGWSTLADSGHWAARLALRMALAAKRAVLRGDINAVKRFLCEWLGFTAEFVTPDLVGSASLVLLDEPAWLPDELLALDYDPRPTLRKLTLAEHRNCTRMITDPRRRANHQPVISLNKPITKTGSDSGSPTSLLELVAAKPQPELVAAHDDISDPRVLRVLAKLTDRERRIAEEQGHKGTTWAEAAVSCGGTPDEGEKARRKVKRLSKTATGPATAPCRQWPDAGQRESVASQAAGT